jgi:hypothetical protein
MTTTATRGGPGGGGGSSGGGSGSRGGATTSFLDLPDDCIALVLEHPTLASSDNVVVRDLARVCAVCTRVRELALERLRVMRVMDLTSLGRRARWAVPFVVGPRA